jgi:hypothetical protein
VIRVTIEVTHPTGRFDRTDVITITNIGPVAPDEAWDSGGERYYEVVDDDPFAPVRIRHFRRDGRRALVVKAIEALG